MQLHLSTGTLADYQALAPYHYRGQRPATMSRILTLRHDEPTAAERFVPRRPRGQVVAVLVESLPALACRLRDEALGGRYAGLADATQRALLLNAEVRCISRVIVAPPWRGSGLAVRLVSAALASATTRYTEAIAVMGLVNPFFARAGMTMYRRAPHAHDAKLAAALEEVGIDPAQLVLPTRVEAALQQLAPSKQRFIETQLRRWYRSLRHQGSDITTTQIFAAARLRLLCPPAYFIATRT